jgi:ABC-2 type transport system permease protein
MGPWRLELLRLWRTQRIIALGAIFLILGFGIPILTYYLPEIVKNSAGDVEITVPKQTAADSMAGFASNVAQLGTLIVVVVAAATLAIDARPNLSVFYRTRIHRPALLILPRYVVIAAATSATLAIGTLGAWYETTILLGTVPVGDLAVGLVLEALWFCFVISVVAAFTGVFRGVLGVVGCSIALLLALALLGSVLPSVASWLPTRLSSGSAARIIHPPAENLWQPVVIASVGTIVALGLAVYGLSKREL